MASEWGVISFNTRLLNQPKLITIPIPIPIPIPIKGKGEMTVVVELDQLLKSMSPEMQVGEYAFCTLACDDFNYKQLNPLASFKESEGITVIVSVEVAIQEKLAFSGTFKQITLTVHSSLQAVGLTAAVAGKLASYGISANVVAAYYHDHIFVQTEKAQQALLALKELGVAES